ncbi:MAG TPA: patatin-like phospholipase family protein [Bacillota bacterium]
MKIDGVFSGGGVKAYAFIGALESIYERKLVFERVAGTSAGSIIAAFLAAGYPIKEMKQLVQHLDLKKFLDPPRLTKYIPASKWLFLYLQMGLYKGNQFEDWLYDQLAKRNIYTFSDLRDGYLKVVVSDLTLGKLVVIPDDLQRLYNLNPKYFPVAKAVRMSSGFPYFFMPKKLLGKTKEKSLIVDGGLLSNFPLWIFKKEDEKSRRPVLGVKLSESTEKSRPHKIKNSLDMLHALFLTMKQAHDARYISESKKNNIIFIPVDHIDATDFHLSEEMKKNLMKIGKQRAKAFLNHWPR